MADQRVGATPSLVDLLTVLQRQAIRGLSAALAEDGASVDQWRVLRALADGENHTMGGLADALQIAPASLTRVMDGLADASLVYRRQPTADRRRVTVHLARQGRSRLDRLEALAAAHENALRADQGWIRAQHQLSRLLAEAPVRP